MVEFFYAGNHTQGVIDEKVGSALAHWEHEERDGIETESRRISEGFFVRALSG